MNSDSALSTSSSSSLSSTQTTTPNDEHLNKRLRAAIEEDEKNPFAIAAMRRATLVLDALPRRKIHKALRFLRELRPELLPHTLVVQCYARELSEELLNLPLRNLVMRMNHTTTPLLRLSASSTLGKSLVSLTQPAGTDCVEISEDLPALAHLSVNLFNFNRLPISTPENDVFTQRLRLSRLAELRLRDLNPDLQWGEQEPDFRWKLQLPATLTSLSIHLEAALPMATSGMVGHLVHLAELTLASRPQDIDRVPIDLQGTVASFLRSCPITSLHVLCGEDVRIVPEERHIAKQIHGQMRQNGLRDLELHGHALGLHLLRELDLPQLAVLSLGSRYDVLGELVRCNRLHLEQLVVKDIRRPGVGKPEGSMPADFPVGDYLEFPELRQCEIFPVACEVLGVPLHAVTKLIVDGRHWADHADASFFLNNLPALQSVDVTYPMGVMGHPLLYALVGLPALTSIHLPDDRWPLDHTLEVMLRANRSLIDLPSYRPNSPLHHTVKAIEERNRRVLFNWQRVCALVAFYRANLGSPFRDSVLFILPDITHFIAEPLVFTYGDFWW